MLIHCSSKLVSLILNMTKNSESYLNQLVDVKAFQLIGYLLEKVNTTYFYNYHRVQNSGEIKNVGKSIISGFWLGNLW